MKVTILGECYNIECLKEPDEYMKEENCDGYVDFINKIIKIDCTGLEVKPVLRHEIIHAFLYESGIDVGNSFHTEETVDYFALQFSKMNDVMKQTGAL